MATSASVPISTTATRLDNLPGCIRAASSGFVTRIRRGRRVDLGRSGRDSFVRVRSGCELTTPDRSRADLRRSRNRRCQNRGWCVECRLHPGMRRARDLPQDPRLFLPGLLVPPSPSFEARKHGEADDHESGNGGCRALTERICYFFLRGRC
jgi:hypothetical protein